MQLHGRRTTHSTTTSQDNSQEANPGNNLGSLSSQRPHKPHPLSRVQVASNPVSKVTSPQPHVGVFLIVCDKHQ